MVDYLVCFSGARITINQEGERKAVSCSYSRDGRTPGVYYPAEPRGPHHPKHGADTSWKEAWSGLVQRVVTSLQEPLARAGHYLAGLSPPSGNDTVDTTKNSASSKMSGAKKNPPAPALHKVIMVGSGGVGKSALTLQFMYDEVSAGTNSLVTSCLTVSPALPSLLPHCLSCRDVSLSSLPYCLSACPTLLPGCLRSLGYV